jgi:hypothetical protein
MAQKQLGKYDGVKGSMPTAGQKRDITVFGQGLLRLT